MNIDIINKLFPDMVKLVEEGYCPTCKAKIKVEDFRDELSLREFKISGLCMSCQDKVFGQ